MIAVSSFRPFRDSPEAARNQARAFASWLPVFDHVFYLNAPEPALASPQTTFVPGPNPPPIHLLAQLCAIGREPACIINADIVLQPKARRVLRGTLAKFDAASSFRLEYTGDMRNAKRVDNGLDLFVAWPAVWRKCWPVMPRDFRIGKPVWDCWLHAWLRDECRLGYTDLSGHKFVFHPRHSRKAPA